MNWLLVAKILQIIIAVILTVLVLLQSKGTGMSGFFGGAVAQYRSRRGLEKVIFILTIVFGFFLVINSLVIVLLS